MSEKIHHAIVSFCCEHHVGFRNSFVLHIILRLSIDSWNEEHRQSSKRNSERNLARGRFLKEEQQSHEKGIAGGRSSASPEASQRDSRRLKVRPDHSPSFASHTTTIVRERASIIVKTALVFWRIRSWRSTDRLLLGWYFHHRHHHHPTCRLRYIHPKMKHCFNLCTSIQTTEDRYMDFFRNSFVIHIIIRLSSYYWFFARGTSTELREKFGLWPVLEEGTTKEQKTGTAKGVSTCKGMEQEKRKLRPKNHIENLARERAWKEKKRKPAWKEKKHQLRPKNLREKLARDQAWQDMHQKEKDQSNTSINDKQVNHSAATAWSRNRCKPCQRERTWLHQDPPTRQDGDSNIRKWPNSTWETTTYFSMCLDKVNELVLSTQLLTRIKF